MTAIDDLERHRAARDQRLRSPEGWLALTSRTILNEGDNGVEGGTASLRNGEVTLRIGDSTHIWPAGVKGPGPFFFHGHKRYEILRQADKTAVRVRDPASPTLAAYRGLSFYQNDDRFRVDAELTGETKTIILAVGLGVDVEHTCPGTLAFSIDDKRYTLDPVVEDGELFILFRDGTNTKSTYGAGRFLYAPMPDAHGRVLLDFNKAFNPPCALTEHASCPIAPPQNRLALDVTAGEKYPLPT
ncbi:MAG TPA: DUF1684 domain-containing protein [Myxococcota bacterium]|jgi:hypothetical protein